MDKDLFKNYNKFQLYMNENQTSKRIFFWTLFTLFWLISAIIIGYAFGYRFNPKNDVFVYGGSLTLKTTPETVEIYLNGTLSSSSFNLLNNSYHVNGLKPGNYFLEVKAPGYQTWSKKITVHSGISTEFWNVVLVQDSYLPEDFNSAGIERFFISPYKNLAAFPQKTADGFSVKVIDLESTETSSVFSSTEYAFTDDEKENIEWTPQAHRIIVPAVKNSEKNYFVITIDTKETLNLKDISQMENLSNVRWDPKNKDSVFFMAGNDLYRMDLNNLQDKKLIAQNIASYDISPKALFYFQLPEGIVYRKTTDASEDPVQITSSAPNDMNDNSYRIIVYDEDRIVFLNKNRKLYLYNKGEENNYFNKISDNATGSQFSDDGKKLLYWTNNEIFVNFVRKWEVQPARAENETLSITRFSDMIKNVQWTRDYEHVLFTNDKKIKLIEIDNRDQRNLADMISLNTDDSILINNFTDGKIYYTDKNDQNQNVLHSTYFPEQTSLLETLLPGNNNSTATN